MTAFNALGAALSIGGRSRPLWNDLLYLALCVLPAAGVHPTHLNRNITREDAR